jgi:hypothetical protein
MTWGHGADDGSRAVAEARRLYRRTVAAWVVDLLALRKASGGEPRWRPGDQTESWREAA